MAKKIKTKRIGIVTGGGDAPGLNATIQAIVVDAERRNWQVLGFKAGWAGPIENDWHELTIKHIKDIQREGGTVLGTSRTNPFKVRDGVKKIKETFRKLDLSALIAIGGEDTLGVAERLNREENLPMVGVPKTIDNDVGETDYTFGFDTAVNRVAESLDRLSTTARAHHRVMVVEIMGRNAGWIALYGGVVGGAHIILIPEVPFSTEEVCQRILQRYQKGLTWALVACAEGANDPDLAKRVNRNREIVRKICLKQGIDEKVVDTIVEKPEIDAFGHYHLGGIAKMLANEIGQRLKSSIAPYMPAGISFGARYVQLGHLQRAGSPTAFDRMLCIRFGLKVLELIEKKRFGYMVALKGNKIKFVSLRKALSKIKKVPTEFYNKLK